METGPPVDTEEAEDAVMGQQRSPQQLAKFIAYILGRRPDEFGLVPDEEGFVKIKDLLKAVVEEEGWRHVRRANLNEILLTVPDPPIEIQDTLVRAVDRENLPRPAPVPEPPPLLYTCVRKKAHPVVMEKGISPAGTPRVVLSSDPELAERMGRRSDPAPVTLTVQTARCLAGGVAFARVGEALYLAESVPAGCFTGPALPRAREEKRKPQAKEVPPERNPLPGSYLVHFRERSDNQEKVSTREKKRRDIVRDKDKRRARRQKQKDRSDF